MLTDFNFMKILLKTILELNEIPTRVFYACGTLAKASEYNKRFLLNNLEECAFRYISNNLELPTKVNK